MRNLWRYWIALRRGWIMDDERYDENWDAAVAMINVSSVEQYDAVMRQIAGGWGSDSRFY